MPGLIERKQVGSDTISPIGLGTYGIKNYSKAFEAYVYGLTNGIDHVDTAEMYDMGRAEEFVGEVLKQVGRDGVFITTKMLPNRLDDREKIVRAAQESLRRIGVSYVDLYLIHWPNERLSITQQVQNFEVLVDKGLTRYIGVSNFSLSQLKEAVYATKKAPIVALQVHYSVLNRREVEEQLLPYCAFQKILLQAYTPIERGSVKDNPCVRAVSEKTGRTPIQVALNYLISHENVVAIPKAERVEHVKELIGAMGWRIPEAHINYLRKCLEEH
ncbi:aldo/keto reductase [Thermosphaera chiliense]|uniref:Aldo/keto reductase n=1 Tax=Thermosphaera chiliense TaxID=3402707 RepID=A0A7M1US48_9CREN|nr:aldo/keto reductase [Thermosphaera aggregans]QOR93842.1 aldo/keto reductase [Thermosphaera aggregans]